MNKICTSIEQSKKLIELGIDVNTADMCWSLFTIITNGNKDIKQVLLPISYGEVTKQPTPDFIERFPAWSLTALLNALPVTCDDGRHCLALINSNPNGEIEWLCCYEDCYGDMMLECYADNPVDACYELILKLKEENLL